MDLFCLACVPLLFLIGFAIIIIINDKNKLVVLKSALLIIYSIELQKIGK